MRRLQQSADDGMARPCRENLINLVALSLGLKTNCEYIATKIENIYAGFTVLQAICAIQLDTERMWLAKLSRGWFFQTR